MNQQELEKQGWVFERFYAYKIFDNIEVGVEFCIGDCCVALYDKDSKDMISDEKYRAKDREEAFAYANDIINTYRQRYGGEILTASSSEPNHSQTHTVSEALDSGFYGK